MTDEPITLLGKARAAKAHDPMATGSAPATPSTPTPAAANPWATMPDPGIAQLTMAADRLALAMDRMALSLDRVGNLIDREVSRESAR